MIRFKNSEEVARCDDSEISKHIQVKVTQEWFHASWSSL